MPRSTAKSKHNANGKSYVIQTAAHPPTANVAPKPAPANAKRANAAKQSVCGTESATEQVFHRKSERRRVARDIFLVFEEQTSSRRSRGSNKKQTKPKFGHLKVEDPIKSKGLLRDIKNEPKCYLSSKSSAGQTLTKLSTRRNVVNNESKPHFEVWTSTPCPPCKCVDISATVRDDSTNVETEKPQMVARVNPIFLWAKQDNTRIIEVRCEDYDKRNRIRITKTSNGWRAIPRSDPTSSKVLKLYTSPLVKVKREHHNHESNHISRSPINNVNIDHKPAVVPIDFVKQTVCDNGTGLVTPELDINQPKKKSSKKSKRKKSKKSKKAFTCKKAIYNNSATISNVVELTSLQNNVDTLGGNIFTSREHEANEPTAIDVEDSAVKDDRFADNSVIAKTNNSDIHLVTGNTLNGSPSSEINCTEQLTRDSTLPEVAADDYSFQLCPKTGLFMRCNRIGMQVDDDIEIVECQREMDLVLDRQKKTCIENKHSSAEDNSESLEAKTRNLKDLLDDADLFQHCDDNANSDADLIDTLVKSSCENNLIQNNGAGNKDTLDHIQSKNINDTSTGNNHLVELITTVSDPPKCLSFNEAGEIEGLNCELFQSNTYIDSFEKQSSTNIADMSTVPVHSVASLQPTATRDNLSTVLEIISCNKSTDDDINVAEDSPKDLSYKKREEVCPPSESRSQCAVTSSSDIIKSPKLDDSSVLTSSSETLKNLILEQFIKLNTLSKQQKDTAMIDKQADDMTHLNSIYTKSRQAGNVIETVVIDDDDSAADDNQVGDDAEPLKKRQRSEIIMAQTSAETDNVKSKIVMTDKDPDPLTQLRLLIRNSQWKVPDPILVPKDRLSAVLASPAREIPLLITTRPELRLPEAFAYPEIIQNPNILVISMAQLEAILKNDLQMNKPKERAKELKQSSSSNFKQNYIQNTKYMNDFHVPIRHNTKQTPDLSNQQLIEDGSAPTTPLNTSSKEELSKCAHIESSLPSDINAATMAVLNQMLWLPYFGQISQDFMKTLKNPNNITQKMTSLLPFCGSQLNGTQHIEDKCEKNTRSQPSSSAHIQNKVSAGIYGNSSLSSSLKQSQGEEFTLFQKILQHQMQNVVQNSQTKINTSERKVNTNNVSNQSSIEHSPYVESDNRRNIKPVVVSNRNTCLPKSQKCIEQNATNIIDVAGKTYNLRSSIASRQSSDFIQYCNIKRSNSDNKPRLTCKSLSNLLDPEHNQTQNMTTLSKPSILGETSADGSIVQSINGMKGQITDNKPIGRVEVCKNNNASNPVARSCVTNNIEVANEFNNQKNHITENICSESGTKSGDLSNLPTETNIPLWHPLFGSNTKSAYSSPWQWTTVTATGE